MHSSLKAKFHQSRFNKTQGPTYYGLTTQYRFIGHLYLDMNTNYVCTTVGEAEFCYYAKPVLSFGQGEEFCKTKYGHLASINSKKEQDAVTALIKSYPGSTAYTWIGYIDNEATGLDWNWIDGMGGYINWETNQPTSPGQYLCAYHYKPTGKWYNILCNSKFPVLCRMVSYRTGVGD